MSIHPRKIIQVIPAQPAWYAVYAVKGEPKFSQIACWALVEEEGDRVVVAMDSPRDLAALDYPDACPNFIGIASPEDSHKDFEEAAKNAKGTEEKK